MTPDDEADSFGEDTFTYAHGKGDHIGVYSTGMTSSLRRSSSFAFMMEAYINTQLYVTLPQYIDQKYTLSMMEWSLIYYYQTQSCG